jgi:hypothetical protein
MHDSDVVCKTFFQWTCVYDVNLYDEFFFLVCFGCMCALACMHA